MCYKNAFQEKAKQLFGVLLLLMLTGLLSVSCRSSREIAVPEQEAESGVALKENEEQKEDEPEYELMVWDAGFESFLDMQPPASFYAQSYYESWNRQYVQEWNYRYSNSGRYGRFYQTWIDYDPHKDYGLDLNYRLYYYFKYIRERYGIVLINRRS